MLDYIFIGLILITWVAIAFLAWRFLMENKALRERTRETLWKLGELKPANSKNSVYDKRIRTLEEEVKNINKRINNKQQLVTTHTTPDHDLPSLKGDLPLNSSAPIGQSPKIIAPASSPEDENDRVLWVKKTRDGLHRLELADKPTGMFLSPKGNRFLLNIEKLEPANYPNIVVLFNDVLEFPVGHDSVGSLAMEKHPEYEKQNDQFIFVAKGRIKVNQ